MFFLKSERGQVHFFEKKFPMGKNHEHKKVIITFFRIFAGLKYA